MNLVLPIPNQSSRFPKTNKKIQKILRGRKFLKTPRMFDELQNGETIESIGQPLSNYNNLRISQVVISKIDAESGFPKKVFRTALVKYVPKN